jgi:dTDP-4-dehydrorhamnose reductase
MKTLILGSKGQLGWELQQSQPAGVDVTTAGSDALDITDLKAVLNYLRDLRPQVIINCAAYTAVDGAETKPDLAVSVNAQGPGNLARGAERIGARLVHVSTDFVFDGSASTPYLPQAETRPLSAYGHSKLAGERRVQEILPLGSVIVRTSWLYSSSGANFVKTMLKLMRERDELRVVADQIGAPTWARGLAETLWGFTEEPQAHAIYHWTDAGYCSWYDFACAIYEEGRDLGLLKKTLAIEPISTREYPTPARRPAFSVLDCSSTCDVLGVERRPWREQLRAMMQQLVQS